MFDSFFVENKIAGPNGNLSLVENRINIGRTLQEHAYSLNGVINLDTSDVLRIIKYFNKERELVENRMTGDETFEHPTWDKWKAVRSHLQVALINKEKQS